MLCQSDLFFSVKIAVRLPYQSADHVDQLVAAKPGEAGAERTPARRSSGQLYSQAGAPCFLVLTGGHFGTPSITAGQSLFVPALMTLLISLDQTMMASPSTEHISMGRSSILMVRK